jgi:thiamine biosynthesis lipoprotein
VTALRQPVWSAAEEAPVARSQWAALGTTAVLCTCESDHDKARTAVEREIEAIDLAASRFRADSELAEVNRHTGRRVLISPLLMVAISLGLRAAAISDGAVDPTLGRVMVEIGYDRDFSELQPAGTQTENRPRLVARRRRRRLWEEIELWADPPAVRVPAGVELDLGATAKALAADRAAQAAQSAAAGGVLVALGGDIATCGPAPPGGWLVHVTDDHRDPDGWPGQTIALHTGALATSSVVARRWLHKGRVHHHILDPRRGQPVQPTWRTVSAAAATCADANIATTAAVVLGAEAERWLTGHGLPARLVAVDGSVRLLSGWPR